MLNSKNRRMNKCTLSSCRLLHQYSVFSLMFHIHMNLCCDLTFIYPPESGVRAAVLQAGVLPFIYIYNVPVFSADGHGEQDEAEQPAQTRRDHNCPKVHLHQLEYPSDDSLTLSTGCSHSGPLKPSVFRHIKAHDSSFISPDVFRLKEEAALSNSWMKKPQGFPHISRVRAEAQSTLSPQSRSLCCI